MQLIFMWNVPLSGNYNGISWEMNMGRMVAFLQYAVPHTVAEIVPWTSYQIRKIAGCVCAGNAGNVFPRHRGLAIPTYITARAWRTCRDACRGRLIAVSFEVGGGKNVPDIPGACATHTSTYLKRGPFQTRQNATCMQWLRWPIACVVYILYSKPCDDLSNKILLWLIDCNVVDYLQN